MMDRTNQYQCSNWADQPIELDGPQATHCDVLFDEHRFGSIGRRCGGHTAATNEVRTALYLDCYSAEVLWQKIVVSNSRAPNFET